MTENPAPSRAVRFADFKANLRLGQLYKHNIRISLPEQSFQILAALLERPGELVTREQLRARLWPSDTFGDFDHGLNNSVNRLREALCDSAESPRFIETLPRRGYRFVAAVETTSDKPPQGQTSEAPAARRRVKFWAAAAALVGVLAVLAFLIGSNIGSLRQRFLRTSAAASIRSVAVLPLENLTGDASQQYFVDGMTDAMITELAQIRSLRVISRTSSMQYKRSGESLPQIARELNVDAVVEGTVTRSGNRVRIDAQLIRADTDQHMWAGSFERDVRDVLKLQDEVSEAIAAQVRVKLAQPHTLFASDHAVDPEAYQYYLEGRYNFSQRISKEGYDNAIRYFQMAAEKDPDYAPAYAGLAHCYALGSFQDQELPAREAWSKAAAAATKALKLDDQLAEAHTAMADVQFRFDWNWDDAEREYKRGAELGPNDADAHASYALFLALMGRFDEAMAEAGRAKELDPLSPNVSNDLAWVYAWSRRWDEAIVESQRTLHLDPNFILAHDCLARCYEEKRMYPEMVREDLKVNALRGDGPMQLQLLQNAYAAAGVMGFWKESLKQDMRHASHPRYFEIARLCLRLGRTDEAFYWLERAYKARYQNMPNIKIGAQWLDAARSDPRYADLLRRLGLPL